MRFLLLTCLSVALLGCKESAPTPKQGSDERNPQTPKPKADGRPKSPARGDGQIGQQTPKPKADGRPKSPARPDWAKAGDNAKAGDVEVEFARAFNDKTLTNTIEGDELKSLGSLFKLTIKVTNHHGTKNVRFAGWNTAETKLEDEFGNEYKLRPFSPSTRLYDSFGQTFMEANTPDAGLLLPGQTRTWSLYFEAVSGKASEARLLLPGAAIGRSGHVAIKGVISPEQ